MASGDDPLLGDAVGYVFTVRLVPKLDMMSHRRRGGLHMGENTRGAYGERGE